MLIAHNIKGHQLSLLAKHSLRFGYNSHGSPQLDESLTVSGHLKSYVQVFQGNGESMIDYSHKQTTIGLGYL